MYDVSSFYSGKTVLITGGTGFLGKVLLYKLITACPDVEKVYLLIRTKNKLDAEERLQLLKSEAIFDSLLRDEGARRRLEDRVQAVEGDVGVANLGLNETRRQLLQKTVNVVLHSAATVKFNEELSKAMELNVEGTRSMLHLALQMPNLKAFVHVSTAFAHCNLDADQSIREDFYQSPSTKELDTWPNTYTFTKALAEQLILDKQGQLPLAIVRPSIVTAALQCPTPGWIDNLNGPTGTTILSNINDFLPICMILGGATGVLRTFHVSPHKRIDLVPVDSVINLVLSVSCFISMQNSTSIPIFNFASGPINPLYWRYIKIWGEHVVWSYPFEQMLWYPEVSFRSMKIVDRVFRVFLHFIPALVVDLMRLLIGHKPKLFKTQRRIANQLLSLEFFANRDFKWNVDNVLNLLKLMSKNEKNAQLFDFDLTKVNWRSYYEHYFVGIRRYALKQNDNSLEKSRNKIRMFYILNLLLQSFMFFVLTAVIADAFGSLNHHQSIR